MLYLLKEFPFCGLLRLFLSATTQFVLRKTRGVTQNKRVHYSCLCARVQNRGKLVGATWEQSLPWGQSALAEEVEHASVAISFVVH